ncbi:MAG: oxidoreductase [Glaciihabitans sp.]|nr:oxidoreductase [Glaciihabitans sp.]
MASATAKRAATLPTTVSAARSAASRRSSYRRRAIRSDLLVIGFWASGALAAALYLLTGGAKLFSTPAAIVTSLGIVTGLIGTDFILAMLVLAARVPAIDSAIGHDRAMALHRALGKPALYLILAHAVLLLLGYAATAHVDLVAQTVSLWNTPDMPIAFLGTGLLIAVVVTSLVAVRRKFSYEAWHIVHLLSYAAVLFALPHQLSVGGVLAQGTAQRVYWIALYVLALGSIITFRFVEPVVSTLRHRLRVDLVEKIAPGVVSIHLRGNSLRALESSGGQFFVWRFWTPRTWWHAHPISLSAVPTDSAARITVRDLGTGSKQLGRVPRGTFVSFEGPYGLFTDAARTAPKLAIIAAGIGITPVRALLEHSTLGPGEATILLRASTEDETYLWDEMQELATSKGAKLYTTIGPRSRRAPQWMASADASRGVTLRSIFPWLNDSDVFICGPQAWTDLVEAEVLRSGINAHQVHTERFDW